MRTPFRTMLMSHRFCVTLFSEYVFAQDKQRFASLFFAVESIFILIVSQVNVMI